MAYRPKFNSKKREALWQREKLAAYKAGLGSLPICNLCNRPVREQDAWDESHAPERPKAFGGKSTGIAHRLCNHEHGAKVVTPAVAKSNRVRAFHIGASGPGLGKSPMRAGRRSPISKSFGKGVVRRTTLSERLAATRAALCLTAADGTPVGLWADDAPQLQPES